MPDVPRVRRGRSSIDQVLSMNRTEVDRPFAAFETSAAEAGAWCQYEIS